MDGLERRSAQIEVRASRSGRRLEGYAALFNRPTVIGGSFTETILPGTFRRSLEGDLLDRPDIVALVDHDRSRLLARTRSGTLRLAEDSKGLAFDLDVPDTQTGKDILALAERGDLGGMSFGFLIPEGGDSWQGRKKRELRQVDLREISVVQTWPAYDGTIVYARSATGKPPSRVIFARRFIETLGASS